MIHLKEGITSFVERLKAHPLLAVVCGFEPDSVPGVGIFYDFLDRFWLGDEPPEILGKPKKKKAYTRCTTVELIIRRILVDYDIEGLHFRAEKRWFWVASLAAINMHLDAQGAFLK